MKRFCNYVLIIISVAASWHYAEGQIRLPKLISDNAILQRGKPIRLFGWSSANEKIQLTFSGKHYLTTANSNGEWTIDVPPQKAGGPFNLKFRGKSEVVVKNILFGDVWLCSGQSNMEMLMNNVKDKYPDIVASSANPSIRQFAVPQQYDFKKPNDSLNGGSWREANPESVLQFSAVAYFFAKELFEKHGVPIGLLNATVGGAPVESWMSEDALLPFPDLLADAVRFRNDSLIKSIETSDRNRINEWYAESDKKDRPISSEWEDETLDVRNWSTMKLPGYWDDNHVVSGNGVVWFRRTFEVEKSLLDKPVKLLFGRVVDQDSVFINGEFVGTTTYQYPQRRYSIKPGVLKEGTNTIAIKVINSLGKGGFVYDKPYQIFAGSDTIDLRGQWKYKASVSMLPLAPQTFIRWKPLGLYNAMIAPLVKYRIAGVIWYQGESNLRSASEYKNLFPALIKNWRSKWNENFPFLFVQLPNFSGTTSTPSESSWADFRQAQYETLKVPNTRMAVTIDIGEWNDIHPLNKKDVGHRLALHARKVVYGETKLIASGPEPEETLFGKTEVSIKFKNAPGGLVTRGSSEVQHIALSSDGENFVWAKSEVNGSSIRVWHESIVNPVVVRYAWADNPAEANVYNQDGLPAGPFEIRK